MSSFLKIKRAAHLLLPPILTQWLARKPAQGEGSAEVTKPKPLMEYAPNGWNTPLQTKQGWNVDSVISAEEAKWKTFCDHCQGVGPLGFSHEHTDLSEVRDVAFHNIHMTYAYVLALAARQKTSLSILDWGGALGHYYQLGKALLPDVALQYHCKEVPVMAEAGKRLNPEVHWYVDESFMERSYDLVMINASLQYAMDWQEVLGKLAGTAREFLFLTRLPVVDKGPSFVAIQRAYETEMLHQQFNREEVLQVVGSLGFDVVREFVVGSGPHIEGAPEQCKMCGWLFKRRQI